MLATTSSFTHFAFMPTRPSPLSERHINVNAAPPSSTPFTFGMSIPEKKSTTAISQSQRVYRPNPVVQTRDAATQKRRDMFFRRVQKGREDKKWEERGEQIQRLDYLSEHKRWEAEKARQATEVEEEILDEDDVMGSSSYALSSSPQLLPEQEMQQAEYMNEQEEWELQQLIASMEEERGDDASQHYGSDDEDYDSIFMDCAATVAQEQRYQYEQQRQHAHGNVGMQDVDEMDMS